MIWPFSMAEEEKKPQKSKLVEAEDYVSGLINGHADSDPEQKCAATKHRSTTYLERLIMLKTLRIEFPHLSTNLVDLDMAIRRESKK